MIECQGCVCIVNDEKRRKPPKDMNLLNISVNIHSNRTKSKKSNQFLDSTRWNYHKYYSDKKCYPKSAQISDRRIHTSVVMW